MRLLRFEKFRGSETGAAIAETALTIMTFLIIILGIIQLTLAINTRLVVNYAAYQAARAGIVHNGDLKKMKTAAVVALSPILAGSADLPGLVQGLGEAQWLNVKILSPSAARFQDNYKKRFFPELKRYGEAQNDQAWLDENLLVVKVTYHYPLRIPLINQMLSPFFHRIKISATHRMRMQSDAVTERERSTS